jgi:hypothetical protein
MYTYKLSEDINKSELFNEFIKKRLFEHTTLLKIYIQLLPWVGIGLIGHRTPCIRSKQIVGEIRVRVS